MNTEQVIAAARQGMAGDVQAGGAALAPGYQSRIPRLIMSPDARMQRAGGADAMRAMILPSLTGSLDAENFLGSLQGKSIEEELNRAAQREITNAQVAAANAQAEQYKKSKKQEAEARMWGALGSSAAAILPFTPLGPAAAAILPFLRIGKQDYGE